MRLIIALLHQVHIQSILRPILLVATLLALICIITNSAQAENFRVMLYYEAYPPYFFAKGDPRTGINKDLLEAIGDITHDTFTFHYMSFLRAQDMFQHGEIDLEPCVNPTWRRQYPVPGIYTIPHSKSSSVILFRTGKGFPITSPEALIGKTIGVAKGYSYPKYDVFFKHGLIKTVVAINEPHLLEMLHMGRIDQAFMNKSLALYLMQQHPKYKTIEVGDITQEEDVMIRLQPTQKAALARFNRAITQLKESGEIDRIFARYK